MRKTFVTSDIWFNRPMGDKSDLNSHDYNDIIIKNWNETVGMRDDVYVLGGLGISDMYQIIVKLNGRIHILNNYFTEDEKYFIDSLKGSIDLSVDKKLKRSVKFESSQIIALPEQDSILSYFPLTDWVGSETGTYCFHGLTPQSDLAGHNISCKMENWDFKPVCIDDVKNNITEFRKKIL